MRGELDKRLSISKKLGKDKVLLKIELPEKREEKFREKLRNDTQDYLEKKRKRAESKRKAVEHMIGALGMTPERMKSLIDSGFHTYSGKEFEEELRKLPKFEVKVV